LPIPRSGTSENERELAQLHPPLGDVLCQSAAPTPSVDGVSRGQHESERTKEVAARSFSFGPPCWGLGRTLFKAPAKSAWIDWGSAGSGMRRRDESRKSQRRRYCLRRRRSRL